jgi:hypothetical protein
MHSSLSWSAAPFTAALWATEATVISPCPQFHTPIGTETTETPQTRSTGSQPVPCRSSASSMERSEVTPRAREGGGATASDFAPLSISALASIAPLALM